jgi:hypothetical protein
MLPNPTLMVFSSVTALDWLIYAALGLVLGMQMWLLLRQKSLPKPRFWIRLGLNLLLWTVVVLFVVQPKWTVVSNTRRVLLVSDNVTNGAMQQAKDSLSITETFTVKDFSRRVAENPNWVEQVGDIYLMGQEATPWLLSQLSQKQLHWWPFFSSDQLQEINWKGILRKGDLQEIVGKIELSASKVLKIKYGNYVLDSIALPKGKQEFRLRFPAFAIGRIETNLELDEKLLQKVNFYARNPSAASVYFVLENPDFESKTLAEWLGKNGSRVELQTTVAKNTQSTISINTTESNQLKSPDIVITDPANAGHGLVKKALADGKSVFFMNVSNPEQSLKTINATLGTQWRVKKTTNTENVSVGDGLTALPFQFEEKPNQKSVIGYPVAVQKNGGRVGVSLLNETFPLKLSGDTLAYAKIWSDVFQQLRPALEANIEVEAPLWKDTPSKLLFNNFKQSVSQFSLANDTLSGQASSLNPLTSTAQMVFRKSGWQPLQDSLQVYVEDETTELSKAKQIAATIAAHSPQLTVLSPTTSQPLTTQLPDWAWLLLILLCFTAVWIEPKLKF